MRGLLLSILALTVAGCAGYKLGSTNGLPSGSRSVQVNAFLNRTREPRVTEYLAASLRRQLQQDGTFRLETGGGADILLTGEIMRFTRTGLSYQTNDVLTPQEITLDAAGPRRGEGGAQRQGELRPQGAGAHIHPGGQRSEQRGAGSDPDADGGPGAKRDFAAGGRELVKGRLVRWHRASA